MGDHQDEGEERNFQGRVMKEIIDGKGTARIDGWMIMESDDNIDDSDQSDAESSEEDSDDSAVSSASSDIVEDVSSSASSSSNGPLYELSELLAQLPPSQRSGLSKHYQGKSQSFTSLASVKSIEDLAKRAKPYRKRMKGCKSFGLDRRKYYTTPKPMISKKSTSSSRVSFLSSVSNARGSFLMSNSVCKSPTISVQKQKSFG